MLVGTCVLFVCLAPDHDVLTADFNFWTITAQTVVNILALLIRHEGAKLLLLVRDTADNGALASLA